MTASLQMLALPTLGFSIVSSAIRLPVACQSYTSSPLRVSATSAFSSASIRRGAWSHGASSCRSSGERDDDQNREVAFRGQLPKSLDDTARFIRIPLSLVPEWLETVDDVEMRRFLLGPQLPRPRTDFVKDVSEAAEAYCVPIWQRAGEGRCASRVAPALVHAEDEDAAAQVVGEV